MTGWRVTFRSFRAEGAGGVWYEVGVDAEYFRDYAPEAYERAKRHVEACVRLIEEFFNVKV